MKKLFALICVGVFAASMASAQWLVYDYKASIKNLEFKITNVKYSYDRIDGTADMETDALDSYSVVSNSLTGFLVIPMCMECDNGIAYTSVLYPDGYAIPPNLGSKLYIKRSGDKTAKIWKFDADVASGLFAPGVAVRPDQEDYYYLQPTSLKNLKQAWMWVYFYFDNFPNDIAWNDELEMWEVIDVDALTANYSPYGYLPYGFLGFGSQYGELTSTGFGAASVITESSLCGGDSTCYAVTNSAGSLIGWDWHGGACWDYASLWDVCYQSSPIPQNDYYDWVNGVVTGTWSVRLNTRLSVTFNEALDYNLYIGDDADFVLVKKLKASATDNRDLLYSHPYHQNLD